LIFQWEGLCRERERERKRGRERERERESSKKKLIREATDILNSDTI
jgi:hypothetical protein